MAFAVSKKRGPKKGSKVQKHALSQIQTSLEFANAAVLSKRRAPVAIETNAAPESAAVTPQRDAIAALMSMAREQHHTDQSSSSDKEEDEEGSSSSSSEEEEEEAVQEWGGGQVLSKKQSRI